MGCSVALRTSGPRLNSSDYPSERMAITVEEIGSTEGTGVLVKHKMSSLVYAVQEIHESSR